jgi:hypothetical protein
MHITMNKISWAAEIYEHLIDVATDFFRVWECGLTPDRVELLQVTGLTITCRYIVEADYSSDLNDRTFDLSFPIEYLWTEDDWRAIEEDKKFKKNLAAIEAHKQAHQLKLANQEKKDREMYLRLKARFDNDPVAHQLLIEEAGKKYVQQMMKDLDK